jgi:hypothetical protein
MLFLDLDLDFFLNENPYCSGHDGGRLGSEYKPWSASKVRHFLEDRCGLSPGSPVQGRTIESHDGVLDFWRMLIESGRLKIPFGVIHIDAHPDLSIGGGLHLTSEFLHFDSKRGLAMLKSMQVHSGNYLTFAIAYGWVGYVIWVPLLKHLKDLPQWSGNARADLIKPGERKGESPAIRDLPTTKMGRGAYFKILPWRKLRTSETFDYIALSRSPNFTPPESDGLITVIEGYMKQI